MEGSELSCSFPSSTDWGWPDAPTPHAPLKLPPPTHCPFPVTLRWCRPVCCTAGEQGPYMPEGASENSSALN